MPVLTPRATTPSGAPRPTTVTTMADVERYLATAPLGAATKVDYLRAVRRCGELYAVAGLAAVPADLTAFERRWPRKAFDVGHFLTAPAYAAWRRKVIASIKGATGAFAAKASRDARADAWALLIERIKPHTGPSTQGAMHGPSILLSLKLLADVARAEDIDPAEITAARIVAWGDALTPNRRSAINRAAAILDRLRYLPEVVELLPRAPIGSVAVVRRTSDRPAPDAVAAQIRDWVEAATAGEWDEIEDEHIGGQSESARAVKRAAISRFVGDAIRLGLLDPDRIEDPAEALAPKVFAAVVRHWKETAGERTGVSIQTAAHYARCAAVLMRARGLDATHIDRAIKTNPTLAKGRHAGERMSPRAKVFCERLLREPGLRQRFLSLHLHFHRQACRMLDGTTPGALSARDRSQLFKLGSLAAFSAIELYGTPVRISNALGLTLTGQECQVLMPDRAQDMLRVAIPAHLVKNKRPINFKLQRDRTRALDIVEWYVHVIRPLSPGALVSDRLFTGPKGPTLSKAVLGMWFSDATRLHGIAMTCHNFRHGAVSLLVDAHPTLFGLVASYIGDTEDVVRRYYAWIDESKNREQIQAALRKLNLGGEDRA